MGEQAAVRARSCSDIQHFSSGRKLIRLFRDPSIPSDEIEGKQLALRQTVS